MSDNSRSRITITLGDSRQVVKRAGPSLDSSLGDCDSQLTGRKRSVKDRLGGVGDTTTGFDKKRLRVDGRGFSQGDSSNGMGLRKNDLRFRIMQKNIYKNSQGKNQHSDLRDLLSRPSQSSSDSIAARPNVHEQSDARERFSELGNGNQHMSETREPKENMAVNRSSRLGMAKVNDVRPQIQEPNGSGILGRVPSTRVAGSLSHMTMVRSSSSPWTLNKLRQRSPDLILRQRSPDVSFRRRSPDVGLRQRSPDLALRQRSPDVSLRRRSPEFPLRRRSPDVSTGSRSPDSPLRRRSPNVSLRRRSPHVAMRRLSPDAVLRRQSPDVALSRRSQDVALRRRSPDVALRRGSPDVALRRRSPDVALRHGSLDVALRRRSPDVALRCRSPDVALRRRSPDVVVSASPSTREHNIQRGPSMRSYNDTGVGTYMSKDVHAIPRPSVPYMRAVASPAAHAHMSKDVLEVSRPRPSSPYMTTSALASVHAKPMIPLPTPSMPSSNLVQRSSYLVDGLPTVDAFLRSLGLEKYWINFKAEEVDDMFLMRQMGDSDLKDLGIPMGPRKKLLLALQSCLRRQVS